MPIVCESRWYINICNVGTIENWGSVVSIKMQIELGIELTDWWEIRSQGVGSQGSTGSDANLSRREFIKNLQSSPGILNIGYLTNNQEVSK